MDPNRYMEQRQKASAPKPKPVNPQPVQRTNPAQPVNPQPVQRTNPAQPVNPQPVQRTSPAQPANPQPVQRTNPAQPANPQPVQRTNPAQPVNPQPVQRTSPAQQATGRIYQTQPQKSVKPGKLQVSGKRSFGSKGTKTLELPAGVYLVTAYTPYLGMRCMRVSADVEVKPGKTSSITYQTVFDIFNEGVLLNGNVRIN